MAYLRLSEAKEIGQRAARRLQKRAGQILAQDAVPSADETFDVFLSHSFNDAEIILGIKRLAEQGGLRVYVDWVDDPGLDREKVTRETARLLQKRMRACSSLVYAHSANASTSAWMPWELGFFDGLKPGFVWILPLVEHSDSEFSNREYLGLYPSLEKMEDLHGYLRIGFPRVLDKDGTVRRISLIEALGTGVLPNANGW
jgi:hypothetical protein